MSAELDEKLDSIPVIKWIVRLMKRVKLPAMQELSLYDLTKMYVIGIVEGALSTRASSIAFSLFMALFPVLIFLFTLIPFVIPYVSLGNENFEQQFEIFLASFFPSSTSEYFSQIYEQIRDQKRGGLLSSSFLLSIFLMTNGVSSIFTCFEYSYHLELTRNFFRQYAYAFMVGLMLCVLLIIGAIAYIYFDFYILEYLGWVAERGGYDQSESRIIWTQISKLLFFAGLSYLITAILYYFGTREGKHGKFFSYGASMTTLLILLTSYLFGVYVDNFSKYNELYGALAGLLIFMVYIWLNANILLLGFELNVTLNYLRKNRVGYEKDK